MITPTVHQILVEYMAGKDTAMGDNTGVNGKVGKFMGFELYLTNNAYWTGTWTPADNPSDADTLTINGVTITFKTTAATAGQVKIGASTADTLDNLVACLNNSGTGDGTDYVTLSAANLRTLTGLVATDGTTKITVAYEGAGEITVAASETADLWSSTFLNLMAGKKGCVDVVVQKAPNVEFRTPELKLGRNVLPWTLYGLKTFDEGTKDMVKVVLDSSQL